MRRDYLNAFLPQFIVQPVAVIRTITIQIPGPGFNHAEVKTRLHQGDCMVVGGMGADCKMQVVTVDNCHDSGNDATLRRANLITATLAEAKLASIKHSDLPRAPETKEAREIIPHPLWVHPAST